MRRIVFRISSLVLSTGFECWRANVTAKKAAAIECRRVVARWRHDTAESFNTWVVAWRKDRHTRRVMQRVIRKLQNRIIACALDGWRVGARASKRAGVLSARVVQRWMCKSVAMYLDWWKDTTSSTKQQRDVTGRIVARLKNATVAACCSTWYEHAMAQRRAARKSAAVVARWKNMCLARSFMGWCSVSVEECRRRDVMQSVIYRIKARVYSMVWMTWNDFVEQAVEERRHHERREQIMRRVLCRMRQQRLASATESWRDNARNQKAVVSKCRRVIARLANRTIARCLYSWRNLAGEERRRREVMRRIVFRISYRHVHIALRKWFQIIGEELREQALQEKRSNIMRRVCLSRLFKSVSWSLRAWCQCTKKRQALRCKCRRVVSRWSNQILTVGFENWKATSKEKKRSRDVMVRVVHLMGHRGLARAFNSWCEYVQAAREKAELQVIDIAHDQYERTQDRFEKQSRRILMKMLSSHTRAAFDSFCQKVAEAKESRMVNTRIMKTIFGRTLAGCFYSWLHVFRESKKHVHVLVVSTSKSQRRCLQKAWSAWNVHLQDLYMRRSETFYQQQYQDLEEENNVLCIHHLETTKELKARVHTAMTTYDRDRECLLQEFLELHEASEAHLHKMRGIMLGRVLQGQDMDDKWNAFESWLEFAGKGRHCRSCLLSQDRYRIISKQFVAILNRLRLQSKKIEQSTSAKMFDEWKLFASWQRLKNARVSMKLQKATQKTLDRWRATVVSRRQAEKKLSLRIGQRELTQSFEAWWQIAAEQRFTVFTCENLFDNVHEAKTKQCRDTLLEEKVLTRIMWHVASRMKRHILETHMVTWKGRTEDIIAIRGILIQGMMTRVRSSFNWWRCTVSDKKLLNKLFCHAQYCSKRKFRTECLSSWNLVCREKVIRRGLVRRHDLRMVRRAMAQHLDAWNEFVLEARRQRNICAHMVWTRRLRVQEFSMDLWAEVIACERKARAEKEKLEARARHALGELWSRSAGVALEQWMHRTVYQRILRRRTATTMQGRFIAIVCNAFKQWHEVAVGQVSEKLLQSMSADVILTKELLQEAEVEKENALESVRQKEKTRNACLRDRALAKTKRIQLAVAFDSFADRVKCRPSSSKKMQDEQTQTGSRAGRNVQKTAVAKSINVKEPMAAAVGIRRSSITGAETAPSGAAGRARDNGRRHGVTGAETATTSKLKSGGEGTGAAIGQTGDAFDKSPGPVIEFSMRSAQSTSYGLENTNPTVESPALWNPHDSIGSLPHEPKCKEQDERASLARRLIEQSRQPFHKHSSGESMAHGSGVVEPPLSRPPSEDFMSPAVTEIIDSFLSV
jgi:hypothetical protein